MANRQDRIRALQTEHAHLAAEGVPLLAEMERMRAIEAELVALGAEPDKKLAVDIARESLAAGTFLWSPFADPDVLSGLSQSDPEAE